MIVNHTIDILHSKEDVNDIDECLICLEILNDNSNNPIYILECCNNSVHLTCLYKWYMSNNKKTCFLCNKNNPFCNDISNQRLYNELYHENSSENSSENTNENFNQTIDASNNNSELIIQHSLYNTFHTRFIVFIFSIMGFFIIIASVAIFSHNTA